MSRARVELKHASGWFAAGRELLHAAALLPDSPFKLFVWVCLHAERNSGCLHISPADLARCLQKTEPEIDRDIGELVAAGVCRFNTTGALEMRDRFWPYQRNIQPTATDDSEAYVAAVRRLFLRPGCVGSVFSPADERLTKDWRRRGVSLQTIERAISLGIARKYSALINHAAGTMITTLHYFEPLIDEVDQASVSPEYWRYIASRAQEFEHRWHSLRADWRSARAAPEETK